MRRIETPTETRGRPKVYPWKEWLSVPPGQWYRLDYGTDYKCKSISLANMLRQQCRNNVTIHVYNNHITYCIGV